MKKPVTFPPLVECRLMPVPARFRGSLAVIAAVAALGAAGCEPSASGEPVPGDAAPAPRVEVVPAPSGGRIDVLVDGALFTSYLHADTLPVLKKPVLFPLKAASGATVTRGFPLEPRPGERVDHPHQIGLWLNYGDVAGLDFWNNSDAVPPDAAPRFGTIRHRAVRGTESGAGRGALDVTADWQTHDGVRLLSEETRFVFFAADGLRGIDRTTTLSALDRRVALPDNKEGMLGLRVARALEHQSGRPEVLPGPDGRPAEAVVDERGVTGRYRSSEGIEGEAVWGTRGRWLALSGVVEADTVTVVVMDHPQNVGFPTYWHARGYGLFAANPLGQAALSDGRDVLDFALEPGTSTTFRYRILLLDGAPDAETVEAYYEAFTDDTK